jgi:hypothetical protein
MSDRLLVRVLLVSAWLALLAGIAVAAVLWSTSVRDVEVTRTITAHGRLTFKDVLREVSAWRIAGGGLALLGGVLAWSLSLTAARVARRLPEADRSADR